MRADLAKAIVVIGVGLLAYAAMRAASNFVDSPWTPGAVFAVIMAAWILAVRWWYRGEPQTIDPARQQRLFLSSLAMSIALGAAGVVAAIVMMHSVSAVPLSPDCGALPP